MHGMISLGFCANNVVQARGHILFRRAVVCVNYESLHMCIAYSPDSSHTNLAEFARPFVTRANWAKHRGGKGSSCRAARFARRTSTTCVVLSCASASCERREGASHGR